MSRNWIRACHLIVGGNKFDLGDLRVVFAIEQAHVQAPNMARFRVFNVSPSTIAALRQPEFSKVQFYAGYKDNVGLLFSGNIKQTISGHENAVDSYVDLFCADGDQAYISTNVTKTLSAGYTPHDKLMVAIDAMAKYGVTLGTVNLDLSQPKYPRGIPLTGMARDIIRQVVLSKRGIWSIQNEKVVITPASLDTGSTDVALTLSGSTGLIGYPKQTDAGIEVTSLINPAMRPTALLKIDPSLVIEAEQDNNPYTQDVAKNDSYRLMKPFAGYYRVYKITRHGDTRGNDWYDTSMCIGKGGVLLNDNVVGKEFYVNFS